MPATTTMTTRQHSKKRHVDGSEKKKKKLGMDGKKKADGDQPAKAAAVTTTADSSSQKMEPVQQKKPPKKLGRFNLWLWTHSFEELMLWMNEKATEIGTVDVGAELWRQFEPDRVTKVLEAVSELPNLQTIQFSLRESLCTTSGSLCITVLHNLMAKAKGLEKLVLKDIELQGTLEDWRKLAKVFQSHPSLLHLRLENYKLLQDDDDDDGNNNRCRSSLLLAEFIPALGANQTLRILEIDGEEQCTNIIEEEEGGVPASSGGEDASGTSKKSKQSREAAAAAAASIGSQAVMTTHKMSTDRSPEAAAPPQLPATFLTSLLLGETKSSSLQILKLCGLSINDDHIAQLLKAFSAAAAATTEGGVARGCCCCKSLQELLLWKTEITDTGAKDLSRILSVHCPSIKKVNLNDNRLLSAVGCQYIFDSLVVVKSSSSITTTTTTKSSNPKTATTSTCCCCCCCQIQELYLGCSRGEMDSQVRKSLLRLIQKNRTIQKLEVRFAWPLDDTVESLANFERDLWDAIYHNTSSSPVLQYVRLYNDGSDTAAAAAAASDYDDAADASTDQHRHSTMEEENNEKTDLLWATIWERPPPLNPLLSLSEEKDDDEEEKGKLEEETKTDERLAKKSRKISC